MWVVSPYPNHPLTVNILHWRLMQEYMACTQNCIHTRMKEGRRVIDGVRFFDIRMGAFGQWWKQYTVLCNYSPNTFTNSNGITRPVFSSELQKIVMAILVTMTYWNRPTKWSIFLNPRQRLLSGLPPLMPTLSIWGYIVWAESSIQGYIIQLILPSLLIWSDQSHQLILTRWHYAFIYDWGSLSISTI